MDKVVRGRVRKDERTLALDERLFGAAGFVVTARIAGLPEPRAARPRRHRAPTVTVWKDAHLIGPFPLTRRQIYEDV